MKRRLLCALGAAAMMTTMFSTAFAADIPQAPCADVIVYKFRLYNGKQQYRRWNETRGYWVDPYWIDMPD